MQVALSTFAETQKPVEAPVAETPISGIDNIIPDTPVIETPTPETPTPETPVVETPVEENVSNFNMEVEGVQSPAAAPAVAPPTFNFDEEIKKIPRNELLKKAGVTDFAIEMDEYLAKGGNAADYLNAKSIDYNKISDEDLVKSDLRKEYPGFSAEDIDELFLAKYKDIDAVDPTDLDRKRSELQLRADAFKARQAKIEQQQKFKIPDAPILQKNEAYEQWKTEQESQSKLIEQGKQWFLQHDATKALNESKRVTISLGEGVAPFNFNVDKPELITQNLTDGGETWNKLTSTKTGEPDVPKQQLLTLIAFNPQKFINDIFNYGVSTGQRKLVSEGQNATKPTTPVHSITGDKATYRTGTYAEGAK